MHKTQIEAELGQPDEVRFRPRQQFRETPLQRNL